MRKCLPDILILDVDGLEVDPLEMLRQVPPRRVHPYHDGGVGPRMPSRRRESVLSKASPESQLALGLRNAIRIGSFTDPHFAA